MPLMMPQKLVFVHPWLRGLHSPLDEFVSDDGREDESGAGSGDSTSAPASPLYAEPLAQVAASTRALRMISRLGCPSNALLLEQQSISQYKRVGAEHEIIVPGVPSQTNPQDIRAMVLGREHVPPPASLPSISIFDHVLSSCFLALSPFLLPSSCSSLCSAFLVRTTTTISSCTKYRLCTPRILLHTSLSRSDVVTSSPLFPGTRMIGSWVPPFQL